jgi:hypothetical protein
MRLSPYLIGEVLKKVKVNDHQRRSDLRQSADSCLLQHNGGSWSHTAWHQLESRFVLCLGVAKGVLTLYNQRQKEELTDASLCYQQDSFKTQVICN